MEPEIFKTFLERCIENHKKVTIKDSSGYHSGYITQIDAEVIEMTIDETDKSCVIFRKNIASIEEINLATEGMMPGPIANPWTVTQPWAVGSLPSITTTGTTIPVVTTPNVAYTATNVSTFANLLAKSNSNAAGNI